MIKYSVNIFGHFVDENKDSKIFLEILKFSRITESDFENAKLNIFEERKIEVTN